MHNRSIRFIGFFIFVATVTYISITESDETTTYHSQDDKSNEQAAGYSKTYQCLSRYLAYRDIPSFIAQYAHGNESLDYGAGTGFSTQFLQEQGLHVTGVDISVNNHENDPLGGHSKRPTWRSLKTTHLAVI